MKTKEIFLQKGIVKNVNSKAFKAFNAIVPDFTSGAKLKPSDYVNTLWGKYECSGHKERDINGKFFEYILVSLLINKNLLPLYIQAKVAFVPNVDFDLLLYTKEKPIVLSAKTSLRERYKQADLEAIALKYVHRKAESYLLTLDKGEAESVNRKIKEGGVIGINKVILATSLELNKFVSDLKELELMEAGNIEIITASSIVKP